jgi:hypothetical protein
MNKMKKQSINHPGLSEESDDRRVSAATSPTYLCGVQPEGRSAGATTNIWKGRRIKVFSSLQVP